MNHYTLNTGHTNTSPRDEVAADVLATMRPLTRPGDHNIGRLNPAFAGYRLSVPESPAGFLGTLYHGDTPLLTVGVAFADAHADAIWPALESLYLTVTENPVMRSADFAAPKRPPLPWCAVALHAPHLCPPWVGDFERCLAWSWVDWSRPN